MYHGKILAQHLYVLDSFLQEKRPSAEGKGRNPNGTFHLFLPAGKKVAYNKSSLKNVSDQMFALSSPAAFQSSEKQETFHRAMAAMVVDKSTAKTSTCKKL